jgi:hypothetical protein
MARDNQNSTTYTIMQLEILKNKFSDAELFHISKILSTTNPVKYFVNSLDVVLELPLRLIKYSDKIIDEIYDEINNITGIRNICSLPNPSSLLIIEKKTQIFSCYATQGLDYKKIIDHLVESIFNNGYTTHQSNYPEIGQWVLRMFELALKTFEEHLSLIGHPVKLHRGWYWFERARFFIITGQGEMAYYSLLQSKKEDINTFGSSSLAKIEINNLTLDILNKIIHISPSQTISLSISDLDKFVLSYPDLSDLFDNLKCIAFGVMHISNNVDLVDHYRVESNFRLYFTISENLIRKVVERFTDIHIPGFDWISLGVLKHQPEGILLRNSVFPNIYDNYPSLPTSDFRSRETATNQLSDLKVNLSEYPPNFNPIFAYNILSRTRNLFLHNFVLQSQFTANEIRQIVRCTIEYLLYLGNSL